MWIRSQDKKKLIKPTNIFITYDNGTYIIKSFIEKYNYFDLGEYSTEEKAIKVLDMIQALYLGRLSKVYDSIKRKDIALLQELTKIGMYEANEYIKSLQNKVFQMPQEDEVE